MILQSSRSAETPSVDWSLGLDLPMPAVSRTAPVHSTDIPASQASSQLRMVSDPPRTPAYQLEEDIETYLQFFECLARTWRWPEEESSYHLEPLLTGRALEAYLGMDEEQAGVYAGLKEVLLENISLGTHDSC